MYNYKITRLSYFPLCFTLFCSIVFFGELVGILFALVEGNWMSLVSGSLLGVLLGIAGTLAMLLFLFIFNTFAALTGGLSVQLTAQDSPPEKIISNELDSTEHAKGAHTH